MSPCSPGVGQLCDIPPPLLCPSLSSQHLCWTLTILPPDTPLREAPIGFWLRTTDSGLLDTNAAQPCRGLLALPLPVSGQPLLGTADLPTKHSSFSSDSPSHVPTSGSLQPPHLHLEKRNPRARPLGCLSPGSVPSMLLGPLLPPLARVLSRQCPPSRPGFAPYLTLVTNSSCPRSRQLLGITAPSAEDTEHTLSHGHSVPIPPPTGPERSPSPSCHTEGRRKPRHGMWEPRGSAGPSRWQGGPPAMRRLNHRDST